MSNDPRAIRPPLLACSSPPSGEIVGHKTFDDGHGGFRHEPLTREEADALWASAEAARMKRAETMPTDADAVRALWDAYHRLEELGWRDARNSTFTGKAQVIELGSAGIHDGEKDGSLSGWWIAGHGDLWPSNPVLFKATGTPDPKSAEPTV